MTMTSKKRCLTCGAENDHEAAHCHICGSNQFEEIAEPGQEGGGDTSEVKDLDSSDLGDDSPDDYVDPDHINGSVDPAEDNPAEPEVEVRANPLFCSSLTDGNKICGAKTSSPCGRHDSDKQKRQETNLKDVIVKAFNETHGTDHSASDIGGLNNTSAFEFLCNVFGRLGDSSGNEGSAPDEEALIPHVGTSANAPMAATLAKGPQRVNYITSHPKMSGEITGLKADGKTSPDEYPACYIHLDDPRGGLWDHYWVMREKGRECAHCGTGFTLNPNRDR
jgi:hypothetical protein